MGVNHTALLIASSVIKGLAVILTLFRLSFRLKIRRFWWEDAWAAVALLCTVVSIVSVLAPSLSDNQETSFIGGTIERYMFTTIVWSVRMSVIFAIIRIVSSILHRRITLAIAVYFFLCWVTTLSLREWWCMNNLSARTTPRHGFPDCVLPRFEIIFEVAINCIADAITVIFALKFFWGVKLPRRQRRMFLCLFSSSKFLCLFSLAQLITQLVHAQSMQHVFSNLQLGAFMIVCNLLVVVTYVYRVFLSRVRHEEPSSGSGDSSDDDDFTTPAPRSGSTSWSLTTVDLGADTSASEISSRVISTFFPSTTHSASYSEPERWVAP